MDYQKLTKASQNPTKLLSLIVTHDLSASKGKPNTSITAVFSWSILTIELRSVETVASKTNVHSGELNDCEVFFQ